MTLQEAEVVLSTIRWVADELVLAWKNATFSAYPALWLRDNDPAHRDARTGQRLISVTDLPLEPRIAAAEQAPAGHITVRWDDGKTSVYSLAWFRAVDRERRLHTRPTRMPWLGQAATNFAWCSYSEWVSQASMREQWLYRAGRDGLAFLRDVPLRDQAVLAVAAQIGYVRETNYGRVFDVRPVAEANNLAYTSLGLRVHTDNPYRDPVPGFQLLHCLAAAGEGGESLFVDGLAVAEKLRVRNPEAFAILSQTHVRYRFEDREVDLCTERTMIQVNSVGEFQSICYNDRSIAPLPLNGPLLKRYYAAYRELAILLEEGKRAVSYRLRPGDLVLMDNTRILHGRTAFPITAPGTARHLQGCYLDADGLYSTLAVLARNEVTE